MASQDPPRLGERWEQVHDPDLFLAMADLTLAAHGIVEGALAGLHRSPFRGYGAEFEHHREYHPGDDLRYLDWNLYSRHGRFFTKQFRADTNLNLYLVVDASGSMGTRQGPTTKFCYAARAAAALAYLTRRTRDTAGLYLLREKIVESIPPRARYGQFEEIVSLLERTKPSGEADFGAALSNIFETCRSRGIVVVFSDFFDKEQLLLQNLRALREFGHQVIAFQVLDPFECALPESGAFEFVDLETGNTIKTAVPVIRDRYNETVNVWLTGLQRACEEGGIEWISISTRNPLQQTICDFLLKRGLTR